MIIESRDELRKGRDIRFQSCESTKFIQLGPKWIASQLTLSSSETSFCIATSSSQIPLNIFMKFEIEEKSFL